MSAFRAMDGKDDFSVMPRENTTATGANFQTASAIIWACAGVVCVDVAINAALRLPGVPYNARELFPPSHRQVCIAVFSALIVWMGFAPAWIADFLTKNRRYVVLTGVFSAVMGLASWFMLHFAVTRESLMDILGSEILQWGGGWEITCRFLALQALVSLPLIVAGVFARGISTLGIRKGLRRGCEVIACTLPWLVLAWLVVLPWASTDNITELVRSTPAAVGAICLTLAMVLIAANAAMTSNAWTEGSWRGKFITAIITPLLILPAWGLVLCGLESDVHKYGARFPAIKFLLGPNRISSISWTELFLRWSALQIAAVMALAGGMAIALRFRRLAKNLDEPSIEDDYEAYRGRLYAIVAIAWAVLLIVGCLRPFNFQSIGLGDAIGRFLDTIISLQLRWSQSDVLTNIFMFIPLTFCALGAWSRENTRPDTWLMTMVIFVLGIVFSLLLEFGQVFVPDRTVSGHDIISQAIGSVIGLGAWMIFGTDITQWLRTTAKRHHGHIGKSKLLWIYGGVFFLYHLWPFDLTISASQVYRKYKKGMINLTPFGNLNLGDMFGCSVEMLGYAILGYVLALHGRSRGRPLRYAIVGGLIFACVAEASQILVRSRFTTATDVLLAVVGALVGGLIAQLLQKRKQSDHIDN